MVVAESVLTKAVIWTFVAMTISPAMTSVVVGTLGSLALQGSWWLTKKTFRVATSPFQTKRVVATSTTKHAPF